MSLQERFCAAWHEAATLSHPLPAGLQVTMNMCGSLASGDAVPQGTGVLHRPEPHSNNSPTCAPPQHVCPSALQVAMNVYDSLVSGGAVSPERLAYFDVEEGADLLYQLRFLTADYRIAAVNYLVDEQADEAVSRSSRQLHGPGSCLHVSLSCTTLAATTLGGLGRPTCSQAAVVPSCCGA